MLIACWDLMNIAAVTGVIILMGAVFAAVKQSMTKPQLKRWAYPRFLTK
jgi:hypothetical protein